MDPRRQRNSSAVRIAAAALVVVGLGLWRWTPSNDVGGPGDAGVSVPQSAPQPVPAAVEEASQRAAEGQWEDAVAVLERQILDGPPSPAAFQLLAVVAAQAGRDIEAAMAHRAFAALDPSAAADPVFQREFAAALDRVAERAEAFFRAAAAASTNNDAVENLQQHVMNRMVAAGQLTLARQLANEQRLDLSGALMLASIEAQEQTGRNFAWQLLQLVPAAIPQDADNDVELLRNLPMRALIASVYVQNSRGTRELKPLVEGDDAGSRRIRERPGIYRLQAMGVRWIWYALATRALSMEASVRAYWTGQKLISRSGAPLEFEKDSEFTRGYGVMFVSDNNTEPIELFTSKGKETVPPLEHHQLGFTPDDAQLVKVDFAVLLAEKQISLPVESTHTGVAKKRALSSLEPLDVDAFQSEPMAELVKRLAELGYWYSMALKTLSYT